jgi:acetolactate synthase-1/2/3 large subunit
MALLGPHVKWARAARRVADLAPLVEQAFREAQSGVPGPVFVECPVDLLYDEGLVRQWYGAGAAGRSLIDQAVKLYLRLHVRRLFAGAEKVFPAGKIIVSPPAPDPAKIDLAAQRLLRADRPVLLVGSQALLDAPAAAELARAVERLGMPVYLSGMARGLLGKDHPLQLRHQRRAALKEADLVMLAGVPCDFRLDYGRQIRRRACYIAANRSAADMRLNRRPDIGVLGDPGLFLRGLADRVPQRERWTSWRAQLRARDGARNEEIARQASAPAEHVNPVYLCREIEAAIGTDSVLVGDGGDFVATAAYIVSPRGPLAWLDPGAFGTLGVGAGFALGAKLCRPKSEVWVLFGDGALGYSLAEFDTFARHGIPIIGVVGNDAGWTQIAREQVEVLKDDVGTALAHTDYHRVAEGFGAAGLHVDDPELVPELLQQARQAAAAGRPVLVNAVLGKTDFRKGSVSM